jgi:hypothetical protein
VAAIRPPRLPALGNLRVVGGPSQQVSTSWINGETRSSLQFRYTLMPIRAGRASIPPVTVEIDGVQRETTAIAFEVLPARAGSGAPAPGTRPTAPAQRAPAERGADVFVEAEIGATEAWVGQAVPLVVTMYAGEAIYNSAWRGQPSLSKFWVEELDVDPNGEAHRTERRGRTYNAFPIRRMVLVAQTPGRIEIDPFQVEVQVRRRSGDPFDSFFSLGRLESVVRQTEPIVLEVKALPGEGRPADFNGAVGRFELEATVDRTSAAINDAVAVKATVEGDGFLGAVTPPLLPAPAGLKLFDPEVRLASSARRGELVSRKTWEWILVPTAPGELELGPLRFSYFDPALGAYRTLERALAPLVVERGAALGDAPLARGEVQLERRELAFIKVLRRDLRGETPRAHARGLFLALAFGPLVWVPAAIWLGRHRSRLAGNRQLARARRAGSRARKLLRGAARHVNGTSGAVEFHEEVARALVGYVADRFDRSAAGLTYELADDLLASRGLDPTLRRRFRSCLETCDFARFVPDAGVHERRVEVLREANELVQALERAS